MFMEKAEIQGSRIFVFFVYSLKRVHIRDICIQHMKTGIPGIQDLDMIFHDIFKGSHREQNPMEQSKQVQDNMIFGLVITNFKQNSYKPNACPTLEIHLTYHQGL